MYGLNVFRNQFTRLSPSISEQIIYIDNITYQSQRITMPFSWNLNTGETRYTSWDQILPVINFGNFSNQSTGYGIELAYNRFSRSFKYEQRLINLIGGGIGEKFKSTLSIMDMFLVDLN
nr:MAG TPA: hypothetical protein [Caudoviricetes sp.]